MNIQRHFQVWSFTVSHGQLLLRSTKAADQSTRIDVLFKNVLTIHLPTSFDGLSIFEASESEKTEIKFQIGAKGITDRKIFIVRGSNFQGYVIAGAVASHEDEGEYNDPSFFK